MQLSETEKPAVGVLFDADIGSGIDSVLALALLYGLEGREEARVASISVSNSSLRAAAFCDAVRRFYASATPGFFARGMAIGLADGEPARDAPFLTAAMSKLNTGIRDINDTADPATLIRNVLMAQHDQNAVVVVAGSAANVVKTMDLRGVKDLIARKAQFLVFAGEPDGARRLFAEWPTPIVICGREIGEATLFPASSIEKDFAWATDHPVVAAYRAYQPMPYDAPTRAMAAVLYAVRPEEEYFKIALEGRARRLMDDPDQRKRLLMAYTAVASAKPVAKKPRAPLADQLQHPSVRDPLLHQLH